MRVHQCLWVVVCGAMLCGCPKKDDDTPPPPAATTSSPPAATTTDPAATATVAAAAAAAVVKPELDNRSDGVAGGLLAVTGAKATIQTPPGWQVARGENTVATAADKKSALAATGYAAEGPTAKLDKAATAAGLSGCTWSAPESLTVGKDKLATQAADGTCTKGAAKVPAAYMATEGLLVVGGWDEGSDRSALFGAMRSVAKAGKGGPAGGIAACCNALRQNAKSAPPQHVPFYMAAAGVCDSVKSSPDAKSALAQVRSALGAAGAPAECK